VTFTATGSDSKTYTASKASVTFAAGKYYQSTLKMAPATITVTINRSDWGQGDSSITKDGVTVSASMIDPMDGNLMSGGTFSTTLGNFTKIVVTAGDCGASGTGWSGGTWTGTPASTVYFNGNFRLTRKVPWQVIQRFDIICT